MAAHQPAAVAPAAGAARPPMNPVTLLRRAFASNPHTTAVTPAESASLTAAGLHEPTLQRYVVWRKATILLVVIATILSAAVATVSHFTENEDEPGLIEAFTETALQKLDALAPGAATTAGAVQERAAAAKEESDAEKEE